MSFRYRYRCSLEQTYVEETRDESLAPPSTCINDGAALVAGSLTIVDEPHFVGNVQLLSGEELDVTGATIEGFSHTSLTDIGTNTHAQIDAHIGDATKHREINDSATSSTSTYSSSKVAAEIASRAPAVHTHTAADVTNFQTTVSSNADVAASVAHAANVSNPHSVTKVQIGLSNVQNIKDNYVATTAPAATDDSSLAYSVGSRWVNTSTQRVYVCVDASVSAAVWREAAITSTTNVPEGTNLYYTDARFDSRLATKSTTNLGEGTNLYYTDARFDTRLAEKTTTNLTEGTRLYYTEMRVSANSNVAAATAHISNTSNPHSVTKTQVGLSNVQNTKVNFAATTAPTSTDDSNAGYAVGSFWVNTAADVAFICTDATPGAAVWIGGAGATAGGSTSQVQYNSGGSFAGTAFLVIDADAFPVIGEKSGVAPTAPGAGAKLFSRLRVGRNMLSQIDSRGLSYAFQPALWEQKVSLWSAQGNGTGVSTINFGVSNSGTLTTRSVSTASLFTSFRRLGFVTTTTAGTSAGVRHGLLQFFRGDADDKGGFFFVARFGVSSAVDVSTQRSFVGLYGSASLIGNVDPSSLTNILGFGVDAGDSSWSFIHNNSFGTATKDTLTGTFPPHSQSADMMEVRIHAPANSSTVYYSIQVFDGDYYEGSTSTDIPSQTQLLAPQIWTNNGTTALSAGIDVVSMYTESSFY